jgi:PAS domain S-box-containing protein
MIGRTFFDILPHEQASQFLGVVRETLRTGKTHTLEYTVVIGGEERWRSATVSPMNESSVLWVARDTSEHKKMEKEISDSEKKYRELVENALVGVYKVNLSGTIIYVNKAMSDMLEYDSPQELMSVSFSSLYRDLEDSAGLTDELRTFGKTDQNREVELRTKTGKVRNVLINASLDRDVISGMAKDITEIRTLERQFIQTQKLEGLGNIAAGIAHDFNNILGVILGYSDLLGQSEYDREKFRRGMLAISKSADRGKSLVQQLLTFARKADVAFEPVILNETVVEMQRLMDETFPKTIEIRTELDRVIPPVMADTTQIHQILLNICLNARDAMPRGGILSIATRLVSGSTLRRFHQGATSEKYVELRVSDSGSGMDEDVRQKIFEPFFTTKGVGKGTGLGLSVVYGIVESHKGFIDVQSEPGKGTTFTIYFPVVKQRVEDAAPRSHASRADRAKAGNILVIEDEEMLRNLLRSVLTLEGHKVILAADGEEGVATFIANKERIDLVLSDLGLPKVGGEEVVRRIKKVSGMVNVIVASGFIAPEVKDELEKIGVSHFIQKPYKTAEVLKVVGAVLSGK